MASKAAMRIKIWVLSEGQPPAVYALAFARKGESDHPRPRSSKEMSANDEEEAYAIASIQTCPPPCSLQSWPCCPAATRKRRNSKGHGSWPCVTSQTARL